MDGAKRSNRGGARPGAGRKRKYFHIPVGAGMPMSTAEIGAALRRELAALPQDEDRHTMRTLAALLKRIADAQDDTRALLLRRLVAIERHLGITEMPQAPRISRQRPLE